MRHVTVTVDVTSWHSSDRHSDAMPSEPCRVLNANVASLKSTRCRTASWRTSVRTDVMCLRLLDSQSSGIPVGSYVRLTLTRYVKCVCDTLGAFFFNGPGPAVLFRGSGRPGRPKVGPAVKCGRYRPRPPPSLFVFCKWRRQAICKVKWLLLVNY